MKEIFLGAEIRSTVIMGGKVPSYLTHFNRKETQQVIRQI